MIVELWNKFKDVVSTWVGKINWPVGPENRLSKTEREELMSLLKKDYYIILTRHDGHLSTYAIALAHSILTLGKRGYYAHAMLNLEDEVDSKDDFRFIEATGKGVHYSGFDDAFDFETSSVALLKPKSMNISEWTLVMDRARTYLGRPYDTMFDLVNDNALSCVEVVRNALRAEPNYETDYANFEKMISKYRNLDPQMFYECEDFEVVWEKRR